MLNLFPGDPKEHPYILEDKEHRSLHFDELCVQSRMRKDDPNGLDVGYTRAMMGFWLLQPAPRDIIIVGLGGGSLSKYCYHAFPEAVITTVEISAAVIALREDFSIPPDNERFRVIHADAAEYLAGKTAIADVILLDGFEAYGIPLALANPDFYGDCYDALRDDGILATNLLGSNTTVVHCFRLIQECFDNRTLTVKSETSDNIIAFGLKNLCLPPWAGLQLRAHRLQHCTQFNFPSMLDEMLASTRGNTRPLHEVTGL